MSSIIFQGRVNCLEERKAQYRIVNRQQGSIKGKPALSAGLP